MNNSITQKEKNIKRYLPHELKTKEHAVKTYRNSGDIGYEGNIIIQSIKKNRIL